MSKQFRDLLAEIPTCVGVVLVRIGDQLQACTISSLTSLSVELGKEEVLFVLRSGSSTGEALRVCQQFGINILSESQAAIAAAAGGLLKNVELHEFLNDLVKTQNPNELKFENVKLFLSLKLDRVIPCETSDIFICRVVIEESFFDDELIPLIYCSRKFGSILVGQGSFSG
jgi:flavin reductase (DIM6/NTAB) family NADH-FMN oxidoreductase RutF